MFSRINKDMKKKMIITSIIVLIVLILGIRFGSRNYCYIENFDELKGDYENVAAIARNFYKDCNNDGIDTLIINIRDNALVAEGKTITLSNSQRESLNRINSLSYTNYDFISVSFDYVVFWEDERHSYGLLYSENPKAVIKEFKKNWYESIQFHKINNKWYEIGYFRTFIG